MFSNPCEFRDRVNRVLYLIENIQWATESDMFEKLSLRYVKTWASRILFDPKYVVKTDGSQNDHSNLKFYESKLEGIHRSIYGYNPIEEN